MDAIITISLASTTVHLIKYCICGDSNETNDNKIKRT